MTTLLSVVLPGAKLLPELARGIDDALFATAAQAVVDALPAKDLDEFERILGECDEVALRAFIKERAPSAEGAMRERVAEAVERANAVLSALR